jgi:prolipoprotein diacylglyceryltransferase
VSINPPVNEEEPRWQQPNFDPTRDQQFTPPITGHVIVPGVGGRVPPPSTFETMIGTLAKLVWPVAILMIIITGVSFWPGLIGAIVVGTILSALKNNLRQRRRWQVQPPEVGPDQR